MAERKDNRGRILKTGESQRKDGRYLYKYTDCKGVTRFVYSWKLNSTDKVPDGKSDCEALREIEKQIKKDLMDEIDTVSSNESLNQRFEKYMKLKKGLADTTRSGYYDTYRLHAKDQLGSRPIKSIKYTDIKQRYVEMITNEGLKPTSMQCLHTVLFPVFEEAIRDNIIRVNPAKGVIPKIREEYKKYFDFKQKKSLTRSEQVELLQYVKNSSKFSQWYPVIVIMLGTGMRSEEFLGLTWDDVDFENKRISINHALIYRGLIENTDGKHKSEYHISKYLKNEQSRRVIPMSNQVIEAFETQKRISRIRPCTATIDGYSGFIFSTRFNMPLKGSNINAVLKRIVEKHNEEIESTNDSKKQVMLPHMTCHMFRHTFATRFAESNPNTKKLMALMGHSCIETTLEIYAECQEESIMEEQATLDNTLFLENN